MSKWLNKKRQAAKEALNKNAEHSNVSEAFQAMETEIDATNAVIVGMVKKLPHFIHPNPAERLKLSVQKKNPKPYRHAICEVIDLLEKHRSDLDSESSFGQAVTACSAAFSDLLEKQYDMDNKINQDCIDPWKRQLEQEWKDIAYHRKKTRTRRLDYDFKSQSNEKNFKAGKPPKFSEPDVKLAEEKFHESEKAAEEGMGAMLDNDVEQIAHLKAFISAQLAYQRASVERLTSLTEQLDAISSVAATKEKRVYAVKSRPTMENATASDNEEEALADQPTSPGADTPSAKALYDFVPENDGELAFNDGDIITLTSRLDENWLEGTINGATGIFPSNYVEIIVDL